MARPSKNFQTLKDRLMTDAKFRAEYEKSNPCTQVAMAIHKIRVEQGLSQTALAKKLGTTQSVISRIESLDYEGLSLSTLTKVAHALGKRVIIQFEDDPDLASA